MKTTADQPPVRPTHSWRRSRPWLQLALCCAQVVFIHACTTGPLNDRGPSEPATALPPPTFHPMLLLPMPDLRLAEEPARASTALESFVGRDSDASEVLLTLFKDSDINLLVDDAPAGRVTFDIKNTTVEQAFEALLNSLDLAYEWDGDFLRIRSRQNRIFDVDLLAGAMGGGNGNGNGGNSGNGNMGANGGGNGEQLWQDLETDLQAMLRDGDTLLVNDLAGTVTLTAAPSTLRRVEEYIDHLLRRVQAQVSLEARILEVRLSDEFRLGVNWSILPGFLNADETGTLPGGAMIGQTASSGGTAFSVGLLDAGNISVFVDALQGQGQVRVLSSPRVSTLNNQSATIRVVDQVPIIDREIIDSQGGLRTQFTVRFVEAGISVQVRPQIAADGVVTVQAAPRVTEQIGVVTTPDGLQTQPILSTRESSTTVHVPSGQAMVLGGLRRTRKTENLSGVPILSDFPLIGGLFRSTVQTREEVELMMVLVPRIVDRAWLAADVRRGVDRLVAVRRPFKLSSIDLENRPAESWASGILQPPVHAVEGPGVRVPAPAPRPEAETAPSAPTVTRSGLARRLVERAGRSMNRGQWRDATAALEQALSLEASRVEARAALATLLIQRGALDEARRQLDTAARQAPGESTIALARGVLEVRAGAPRAALPYLKRAHAAEPNSVTACNLAAVHILLGQLEAARPLLQQFTDDAPPELFANTAYAHHVSGDLKGARWALDRAYERGADPRNPRMRALRQLVEAAEAVPVTVED